MKPLIAEEGFTFGCDPEFFLVNNENVLSSAYGIIPGTKQEPFKVDGGAVQVDGMAAEINTDPTDNFEDWNGSIITVMQQLKKMLPKGWGLVIDPSVRFSQEVMDAQPDTAKELGCDPDYNAWTGEVNPTPDVSKDPLLRTGAGHLHIGWSKGEIITDDLHVGHCKDLVKQLDWFLGSWTAIEDKDTVRRSMYGRTGAFRPKSYGVEYRVPSNFWLKSKIYRIIVWNRMQAAIAEMQSQEMATLHTKWNSKLETFINTGKRDRDLEEHFRWPILTIR